MKQFIYSFNEGSKEMRNLLGNKGAGIAEMMQIGLPVPFGFTITTKACADFFENGCVLTDELKNEIFEKIAELETVTGKTFGGGDNPLLVSVRTGAADPVPGLAETQLNVGTVENASAQDARQQLLCAVKEAFLSWNSPQAVEYRRKHASELHGNEGVAVSVQSMVFGDLGRDSAVGVATTRNCNTGEHALTGSFVEKSQGKDSTKAAEARDISELAERFPKAYENLVKISGILERHYKDVQSVEFTIENSKLYMLQTGSAERTPEAALKIAVDMASEELITAKAAILRQRSQDMEKLVALISDAENPGAAELREYYETLMEWIDDIRELKVRVNADNGVQAKQAVRLGAEGIGLCRTENLLQDMGKMPLLKELLLTADETERSRMLKKLKEGQKTAFEEIYRVMGERPVTVRLLDLPVTLPAVTEMQTEAVIEAAASVSMELEKEISVEILVPMVSTLEEFVRVKKTVTAAAAKCTENIEKKPEILLGTMIETPRAALIADKIAAECDFFSFGTNDLTQMVFGISRNSEMSGVIENYVDNGILAQNPFESLDIDGVGRLVEFAASMGRHTKPKLKLGICGEQASDAKSIEFCHKIGMNYLSCAPAKVPAAKLAAAQAAVRNEEKAI